MPPCRCPREATIISASRYAAPATRPGVAFLLRHPAHFIALGAGAGLSRWAPGTLGTLLAFPIFEVTAPRVPDDRFYLLGLLVAFFAGAWACGRTGRALGVPDHGGMVFDEIVAFLLVLVIIPRDAAWQMAGFTLFRFFDIVKPPPIRQLDARLKNGLGVMLDDLLAALYTLLVLAVFRTLTS